MKGDFQNKVDFALGHLDQILPIKKSPINSNDIARFGAQPSDGAFREGCYGLRCISEDFVTSQHPATHRHAALNDDQAPMIFDDVRHGAPGVTGISGLTALGRTSKESVTLRGLSGRARNALG